MIRDAIRKIGGVAVAAAVLALAPMPASAQDDVSTLRISLGADLRIFDPVFTANGITRRAAWLNNDFLFAIDSENVPQPQMLESYVKSDDGMTHTFVLRSGLTFHDGTAVTSEDAIASIKRWATNDGAGKALMADVTDMTAESDVQFTVTTSETYAKFPLVLSKLSPNIPVIIPARLAATPASEAITEVIGAGPFRFVPEEFVAGSKVVYERYEDYVPNPRPMDGMGGAKSANFDRVEILNISDSQTAFAALSAGEVDVIINPSIDFIPLMKADPNITVEVTDQLGTLGFIRLNWLYPPFDDVRARKAIQWLVNQDDFLAAVAGDPQFYSTCGAFFVCGSLWGSEDGAEAVLDYDLDKAKALLAEAGYDGEPIVLLTASDLPYIKASGLVMAQALRQAGMNVEIQEMDIATMSARQKVQTPPSEGGWNIYTSYGAGMILSDPMVAPNSAACEGAVNGWPCDDAYEAARANFDAAASIDEAREYARQMQARGSEVVTQIPYGVIRAPMAYRSDLEGMIGGPATEVFWNVRRVSE